MPDNTLDSSDKTNKNITLNPEKHREKYDWFSFNRVKSNPDRCYPLLSVSEKITTNHIPDLKIKTTKDKSSGYYNR